MGSAYNRSVGDTSQYIDGISRVAIVYMVSEVIVAICSIIGNALIIASFIRDAYMRTPTNMYVFSLALADLLVSVIGIPIYLYSMITSQPSDYLACLIVNTWIMMLCTVSIFHLVAVSYDRYLAVVWLRQPDSRRDRMRHAAFSIAMAWICGTIVGFLPLMGWNRGPSARGSCDFMEIMDMRYLLFLFYCTIITPTFLMAFFYVSIFHVVRRQDNRMARQSYSYTSDLDREHTTFRIESANDAEQPATEETQLRSPSLRMRDRHHLTVDSYRSAEYRSSLSESRVSSTQRLADNVNSSISNLHRQLSPEKNGIMKKKASKSRRVIYSFVLVIVSFLLSWYPLYTLNAITYYAPDYRIDQAAFYACIVLSHMSTTINPLIYARTMPGFRVVLLETLHCEKPGTRRRRHSSFYMANANNNNNVTLVATPTKPI